MFFGCCNINKYCFVALGNLRKIFFIKFGDKISKSLLRKN